MNVKDGYIERRGQYINILTKLRKYHKLDFPRREEYEGQPIEVRRWQFLGKRESGEIRKESG